MRSLRVARKESHLRDRVRAFVVREFPVFFALACWIGALAPLRLPMAVGPVALVVALLSRRRELLIVLGLLAVSVMSFHGRDGLRPIETGSWTGTVELISEPQFFAGRTQVDVDTRDGRFQLSLTGANAGLMHRAVAGDHLFVRGSVRPLAHPERFASRHLRMVLTATSVTLEGHETTWRLPVELARRAVLRGAESLPEKQRPIYAGFVIGDDRGSEESVTQSFEASGLSHLLVVSGENVVFILALVTPLVSRLKRRARGGVLVAVLVFFAAVTQFEPSVLRATAMAMIAVIGVSQGQPQESRRRLATAIALLLVVDPLLVESFGFRLSVAATIGITLFGPPLSRHLPGARWLRNVLSMTIAAQVAIAPLVIPVFGPLPLASLPANVLAEPIAGFVMMWGSSVGLLAGIVGGPIAVMLQIPVRVGVWWIMSVASWCSALPLPRVSLLQVGTAFLVVMIGFGLRRGLTFKPLTRRSSVSAD